LWQEYKEAHPDDGYQYSQFCELFKRFKGQLDVVLRQEYRAGEKGFVDYSGDGIEIVDPDTGEVSEAPLFVAVLGASSFTYAESFPSEKLRCWIDGHIHAYEYWDGVPAITIPDNPKTGVLRPCWYDPDLNPTYREMARHYQTAIIPARPRKPKDKAKVENAVLVAQRWILAALRNHTFFSIEQATEAVWAKLEELNGRKFQKLDCSRRELWETVDRPALRALPATRYAFAEWCSPKVNIDYHVEPDKHYYSVPYTFMHKEVEARLATRIMESRPHPQQGFRACLGLIRLAKAYGNERMEAASTRALSVGAYSYRSVEAMLKRGLDRQPLLPTTAPSPPVEHENVRGPDYYH
ncbi:MAG: IS21 family transposase, partial [Candidatus Zixiibacteriota bacterium]